METPSPGEKKKDVNRESFCYYYFDRTSHEIRALGNQSGKVSMTLRDSSLF